ncbi:hypothetical protein GGTG_03556 [Gaeumannomyces tritici R3-111a-1]|uniref:Uncharacterized protein n=1 Tax=Gaeumannomyces tritici (strain R3-111a-1) TaxID=644352 RepID=J3NQK0_GAET3|nr:hypothetical protein GGTG_03556 [Gaeumannomyces tritici R3-111a-1]EJT78456.1 hypothetical protein GGTG_03556 [Gaeumannomyces tritici R3-111a-1]
MSASSSWKLTPEPTVAPVATAQATCLRGTAKSLQRRFTQPQLHTQLGVQIRCLDGLGFMRKKAQSLRAAISEMHIDPSRLVFSLLFKINDSLG